MKFFYTLCGFFIIFVFISLLSSNIRYTAEKMYFPKLVQLEPDILVTAPVLTGKGNFPTISAQSTLAIDLDSGVSLYEKEADAKLLPASTTKIVTALVAMDYYPLDKVLTVGKIKIDGQKMHLAEGEEITIRDLLYGLLINSANDAAEILADNYKGGRASFIDEMNKKAKSLGLTNSIFTNPSGLDEEGLLTTARDLATIATFAMRNPFFKEIVSTREIVVTSIDGKGKHKLVNINKLLGEVDGVLGVKTGWTENASENLVTYIERDGKKIMIVTLGSQDRFGETKEIISWIFDNYTWQRVAKSSIGSY